MDEHGLTESDAFAFIQTHGDERAADDARRRRADHRRRRCGPTADGRARGRRPLLLLDGNSLTYRAFFALPTDMATASRPGHQRGVRVHVDADQPAPGPPARRRSPWPSTGPSRRSATSAVADLQGQPRRRARHPAPADGPGAPGARGARHPDRSSWPGFEADDIIATLADAGRDARRRRHHRHRRPRQPTSSSRTRTSRCSTTGAACRDYALYDEAGIVERTGVTPDAATRSTPRCAATRPTTCPACPAWGRRRRPS